MTDTGTRTENPIDAFKSALQGFKRRFALSGMEIDCHGWPVEELDFSRDQLADELIPQLQEVIKSCEATLHDQPSYKPPQDWTLQYTGHMERLLKLQLAACERLVELLDGELEEIAQAAMDRDLLD